MEAGTAARQQLANTLDQLQRDMAASTAAADAQVLSRLLSGSFPCRQRTAMGLTCGLG